MAKIIKKEDFEVVSGGSYHRGRYFDMFNEKGEFLGRDLDPSAIVLESDRAKNAMNDFLKAYSKGLFCDESEEATEWLNEFQNSIDRDGVVRLNKREADAFEKFFKVYGK